MRVVLGFRFPADYVVQQVPEFSTDEGVLRLANKGVLRSGEPTIGLWGNPGAPAMNLRFVPQAAAAWEAWVPLGTGKFSGIYSTPSRGHACVIAGGNGYWVDVCDPDRSESIQARTPIIDAAEAPDHNMVVFADFIELLAYGPSGLLWRTEQVSWDGIWLGKVEGDMLRGEAWDASLQNRVPFTLDLSTGQIEGGSHPDRLQTRH